MAKDWDWSFILLIFFFFFFSQKCINHAYANELICIFVYGVEAISQCLIFFFFFFFFFLHILVNLYWPKTGIWLSCFVFYRRFFFFEKSVSIIIHAYANELICMFSYFIKEQCLFFYLVPHSLIYIEYRLRYGQFVRCTVLAQYITLGCHGNVDISSSLYGLFFIHLAPRNNLASVRISPDQDMQVGAKWVAYLIQTSLVIPFYKYFLRKWQ